MEGAKFDSSHIQATSRGGCRTSYKLQTCEFRRNIIQSLADLKKLSRFISICMGDSGELTAL